MWFKSKEIIKELKQEVRALSNTAALAQQACIDRDYILAFKDVRIKGLKKELLEHRAFRKRSGGTTKTTRFHCRL